MIRSLIILLLLISSQSYGQSYNNYDNSSDIAYNSSSYNNNVKVYKDSRLDVLVNTHRDIQLRASKGNRGYRIQIYYGNDRSTAIKRNVDFMHRYPSIKTYMSYTRPQYRVKVGNFQTREDAIELYRKAIALYGACMIVPDKIDINRAIKENND